MTRWYVVQTNPNQEAKADLNLRRQNYETWMPCFRKTRRHARKTDTVLQPLFPSYLFVRMDVDSQGWRSINGTFGVRALLCQDSKPVPVPDAFMIDLQNSAIEKGCIFEQPQNVNEGNIVRIIGGAFEDYMGTVLRLSGADRALLLLKILGREVQTLVSRNDIVAA